MSQQQVNMFSINSYIQLFFSTTGILFYFYFVFLFYFYYKNISFIKGKIFSFIFLNSISSLILLFISNTKIKLLLIYICNIISFYLILFFIDKCLISIEIILNSIYVEIKYKKYIVLIYMISFFPYENIFDIFIKHIFANYFFKIILLLLFYENLRGKIKKIFEYLDELKENLNFFNNNTSYNIKYGFYQEFKEIFLFFYISYILFMIYFVTKILECILNYKIIFEYIAFFINVFAVYSLVISCILLFFVLNKNKLKKYKKGNKKDWRNEITKIKNIKIIYKKIPQKDFDESKD